MRKKKTKEQLNPFPLFSSSIALSSIKLEACVEGFGAMEKFIVISEICIKIAYGQVLIVDT